MDRRRAIERPHHLSTLLIEEAVALEWPRPIEGATSLSRNDAVECRPHPLVAWRLPAVNGARET